IGRDSAMLAAMMQERAGMQDYSHQLEALNASQRAMLDAEKQATASNAQQLKGLQAKQDYYKMYESHIDSIIRFNKDPTKLQYHIGPIRQHQEGFRAKLD